MKKRSLKDKKENYLKGIELTRTIESYIVRGELQIGWTAKTKTNVSENLDKLSIFLGKKKLLNYNNTVDFIDYLYKKGLSQNSVRVYISNLKPFLKYIYETLNNDSYDWFGKIKAPKVKKKSPPIITPEEMERIIITGSEVKPEDHHLTRFRKHEVRMALLFQLYTGLRVSEVLTITGNDIDLTSTPKNYRTIRKGQKSVTLPLTQFIVEKIGLEERVNRNQDKLFQVTRENMNSVLKKGARLLNFRINPENLSTHLLRKVCLSDMASNGAPIHDLTKYADHSDPRVTNQYYFMSSLEKEEHMMLTTQTLHRSSLDKETKYKLLLKYLNSIDLIGNIKTNKESNQIKSVEVLFD